MPRQNTRTALLFLSLSATSWLLIVFSPAFRELGFSETLAYVFGLLSLLSFALLPAVGAFAGLRGLSNAGSAISRLGWAASGLWTAGALAFVTYWMWTVLDPCAPDDFECRTVGPQLGESLVVVIAASLVQGFGLVLGFTTRLLVQNLTSRRPMPDTASRP